MFFILSCLIAVCFFLCRIPMLRISINQYVLLSKKDQIQFIINRYVFTISMKYQIFESKIKNPSDQSNTIQTLKKLTSHSSLYMVQGEIESIPFKKYWLPPLRCFRGVNISMQHSHTTPCDVRLFNQNFWISIDFSKQTRQAKIWNLQ